MERRQSLSRIAPTIVPSVWRINSTDKRSSSAVSSEVQKFQARLQTLDVVPTIVSLHDHLETIRQAEIDRVRGRLGAMSPEQELAVEALTRGIVNKIMHTPIRALKTAARD